MVRLVVFFGVQTLTAACIGALLVSALLKPRKDAAAWAAIGVLCSSFFWILLNGTSEILYTFFEPSMKVTVVAGLFVQAFGFAVLTFCEVFPTGRAVRHHKLRLAVSGMITIVMAALIFSPNWIRSTVTESGPVAVYGPYYLPVSLWVVFMTFLGLAVLLWKRRGIADTRPRTQIGLFVTGIAINSLFAITFSLALPLLGTDRYFFLGPAGALGLSVFLIYGIVFHQLFDIRTAFLRGALRVGVSVLFTLAVTAVLYYATGGADRGFSWLTVLIVGVAILGSVWYGVTVHPKIDRFLFQPFSLDTLLREFATRGVLNESQAGLTDTLRVILEILRDSIGFKKGFITAGDRFNRGLSFEVGGMPALVRDPRKNVLVRLHNRVRLPAEFLDSMDQVLLLEPGMPRPFLDGGPMTQRYPRLTQSISDLLDALQEEGFRIVVPLLFKREFCGIVVLGEKENELPYFSREVSLLNVLRVFLATMIRNNVYLDEIRLMKQQADAEVERLAELISVNELRTGPIGAENFVFESEPMKELVAKAREAAGSTHPVLIIGETGTGKELVANYLHTESERSDGPFVAINCAAIPASLLEDEIFGHVKGAFTGASGNRPGRVAAAAGGTLFFDEIGEMSMEVQPKLLRLIQQKAYSPVGSDKTLVANCRFIFATNVDLLRSVELKQFREDLYYRMNIFQLRLPPLRERALDIPLLVQHFLEKYRQDRSGRPAVTEIEKPALQALLRYAWPGNIRELENAIIRAIANIRTSTLTLQDLPPQVQEATTRRLSVPRSDQTAGMGDEAEGSLEELVGRYTRKIIVAALTKSGGNKTAAARQLGIGWSRLQYQMKALNIETGKK